MRTLVLLVVCMAFAVPAAADVVDSSATGFTVRHVLPISAHPSRVYSAAVDRAARWWNPAHTYSKNAANLTLQARLGGCLCEQQTGVAGSMLWKLTESAGGTQFEWTYTVGGYMPGGLAAIAPAVDGVLAGQLQRLKRFVETGRPE